MTRPVYPHVRHAWRLPRYYVWCPTPRRLYLRTTPPQRSHHQRPSPCCIADLSLTRAVVGYLYCCHGLCRCYLLVSPSPLLILQDGPYGYCPFCCRDVPRARWAGVPYMPVVRTTSSCIRYVHMPLFHLLTTCLTIHARTAVTRQAV